MMVEKESGRFVGCEFPSLWAEGFEEGKHGMKMYQLDWRCLSNEYRLTPLYQIPQFCHWECSAEGTKSVYGGSSC